MSDKTWYRPGLVFKAHKNAQGHEEVCRSKQDIRASDGTVIDTIRQLSVEFGVYGNQYKYIDPDTEREETGTEFRGGYVNLDAQADDKGWDDAEKEIVARHMLRLSESGRGQFSLYSAPPVGKPWPKYDEAHHKSIPALADQLGLVGEALEYEKQNKKRVEVVTLLEEKLRESQRAEVADDALTAA